MPRVDGRSPPDFLGDPQDLRSAVSFSVFCFYLILVQWTPRQVRRLVCSGLRLIYGAIKSHILGNLREITGPQWTLYFSGVSTLLKKLIMTPKLFVFTSLVKGLCPLSCSFSVPLLLPVKTPRHSSVNWPRIPGPSFHNPLLRSFHSPQSIWPSGSWLSVPQPSSTLTVTSWWFSTWQYEH